MPYRLGEDGRTVMVQRGGQWVALKRHATVEQARKHLAALQINVEHGGKKK